MIKNKKQKTGERTGSGVRIGPRVIPFNRKANRWLGVWTDARLGFRERSERAAERGRRAEGRLRSIATKHEVPPIAARRLQEATDSSTLLYGAEVTWKRQRGHEERT